MINFKLKHIDKVQPVGIDDNLRINWFWLTDGDLWLNLANSTLYEYSKDALKYFGDKESLYNDYPIARFIEDFNYLFHVINESIPNNFYKLTETLPQFLNNAQKWLDINDTDKEEYSSFYFEEYDNLVSWVHKRSFNSGHLVGGPEFSFFRNKDKIRIVWKTEYKLENGIELWTAKDGSIEMPYETFLKHIEDFGIQFFKRMKNQVELVIQRDWKNAQIDRKRLVMEHEERESDFWVQFAQLKNDSLNETNWERIRELKYQMDREIAMKP